MHSDKSVRVTITLLLLALFLGAGAFVPRLLGADDHRATIVMGRPAYAAEADELAAARETVRLALGAIDDDVQPVALIVANGRSVAALQHHGHVDLGGYDSNWQRSPPDPAPTLTPLESLPAAGLGAHTQPGATPTPPPISGPRAEAVQKMLSGYPLEPYSGLMVQAADAYGIDWRLIAVISYLESLGGTGACGYNAWGYAACDVDFASWEEGIWTVAETLAGGPYVGLPIEGRLCMWVAGTDCTTELAQFYLGNATILYADFFGVALTNPLDIYNTPAPTSGFAPQISEEAAEPIAGPAPTDAPDTANIHTPVPAGERQPSRTSRIH